VTDRVDVPVVADESAFPPGTFRHHPHARRGHDNISSEGRRLVPCPEIVSWAQCRDGVHDRVHDGEQDKRHRRGHLPARGRYHQNRS